MKIALIGSGISSGGLVSMLSEFLRCHPGGDTEVTLFCSKDFLSHYTNINSSIKIETTDTLSESKWTLFFCNRYQREFVKLIEGYNPDSVFFITGTCKKGLEKYNSYIVLNNQLYTSFKRLFKQRSLKIALTTSIFALKFRRNLKFISHVFFSSEYSKKESMGVLHVKDCIVVPFACNSNFYLPEERVNYEINKVVKLLNIGSIIPYKNQLVVIEALKLLRDNGYDFQMTFVGKPLSNGYNNTCRRKIAEYRLANNIKFIEWLNQAQIIEVIDNCDIFINSSETDTCATAVEEGMARCKPVIASDTLFNKEMVCDGGLFFSLDNPKSLCKSIIDYIENEGLRREKAQRGYTLSKSWTLQNTARGYYEKILSDNKA